MYFSHFFPSDFILRYHPVFNSSFNYEIRSHRLFLQYEKLFIIRPKRKRYRFAESKFEKKNLSNSFSLSLFSFCLQFKIKYESCNKSKLSVNIFAKTVYYESYQTHRS